MKSGISPANRSTGGLIGVLAAGGCSSACAAFGALFARLSACSSAGSSCEATAGERHCRKHESARLPFSHL
jgi:hypothetical protein